MSSKRKRYLFNFVGIGIVALWLLMIGMLIKKHQFNYHGESIGITIDNAMIAKTSQNEWMDIYNHVLSGCFYGYHPGSTQAHKNRAKGFAKL